MMQMPHRLKMCLQRLDQSRWQHRDAAFSTFGVTNHKLPLPEIDIFDSQLQPLAQAQPTPIQNLDDQLVDSVQSLNNSLHFLRR